MLKGLVFGLMFFLLSNFALAQSYPKAELGKLFLKADGKPRTVAVLVEEGAVIHDFIASYSILDFISKEDLKFHFVATKKGPQTDGLGKARFLADTELDEMPAPDILIVGGFTNMDLMKNQKVLNWLKKAYETSEYTVTICSGGVLLAATGATVGKKAAVGLFSRKFFEKFGGINVEESVYADGKYFSASGISGGTEVAFELIERITSRKDISTALNVMLEFTPKLKYGSGEYSKSTKATRDLIKSINRQLGFPDQ